MSHGDSWGRAEGTSERSLGGNVPGVLHKPQENHVTKARVRRVIGNEVRGLGRLCMTLWADVKT